MFSNTDGDVDLTSPQKTFHLKSHRPLKEYVVHCFLDTTRPPRLLCWSFACNRRFILKSFQDANVLCLGMSTFAESGPALIRQTVG